MSILQCKLNKLHTQLTFHACRENKDMVNTILIEINALTPTL